MLKEISWAPDYAADEHGDVWSMRYSRRLQPWRTVTGRRRVEVRVDKEVISTNVARLVADAFHGPADGREAHHVNGDPSDDRPENLRWVDRGKHLDEHHPRCETCGRRK